MADDDGFSEQEWRFAGVRFNSDNGKTFDTWETPDGEVRPFTWKRGRSFVVGAVYVVKANADYSEAYIGSAKWDRTVRDDKQAMWVVEDRAAKVAKEQANAIAAAKRSEAEAVEDMTLAQARAFIEAGGPWTQRAARTAVILKYLRIG